MYLANLPAEIKAYNSFIQTVRRRLWNGMQVQNSVKSNKTVSVLGIPFIYYHQYLEDYQYNKQLHDIDHVVPVSLFNLKRSANQLMCFSWFNTMPLTTRENHAKGNRLDRVQIREHLEYMHRYCAEKVIEVPTWFTYLYETLYAILEHPENDNDDAVQEAIFQASQLLVLPVCVGSVEDEDDEVDEVEVDEVDDD